MGSSLPTVEFLASDILNALETYGHDMTSIQMSKTFDERIFKQ